MLWLCEVLLLRLTAFGVRICVRRFATVRAKPSVSKHSLDRRFASALGRRCPWTPIDLLACACLLAWRPLYAIDATSFVLFCGAIS